MASYITSAEVKTRLLGKIKFSNDDEDENAVGSGTVEAIIIEAESDVEQRLSIRYAVPFVHDDDTDFTTLPTMTQQVIKRLCRNEAIRALLAMDFGRGTAVDGEKYAEQNYRVHEATLERLISRRDANDAYSQFKYPPLTNLKLADHNRESDDAYAGRIYLTSENYGEYAAKQMNSPGETVFNGRIIDADDELV